MEMQPSVIYQCAEYHFADYLCKYFYFIICFLSACFTVIFYTHLYDDMQ
jgi:hypothetical protein